MEASVRFLNPLSSTGRIILSKSHRHSLSATLRHGRNLQSSLNRAQSGRIINCSTRAHSSLSLRFPNSPSLGLLLSAFSSPAFHQHNHESFNLFKSDPNDDTLRDSWNGDFNPVYRTSAVAGDSDRSVTAVLLGWLGAETKHLKRYAEIYAARGMNTLSFVVPVSDLIRFDLGRKVESGIERLAKEIVAWLEDSEKRCLVFHTFSNTGWFVYGAILGHMQGKPELIERIRGCVMDSGPDPELNPQVWAAGFATAMLKKRSSSVSPAGETGKIGPDSVVPKPEQKESDLIEGMLLFVLEKLFTFLFKLPDMNQRLTKIITNLSENSPSCPQLYLYSTGDKVVPFQAVETFIEQQRRMGKKIQSFNFQSTPHVDHFRAFPDLYTSKVSTFLDECLSPVKQV